MMKILVPHIKAITVEVTLVDFWACHNDILVGLLVNYTRSFVQFGARKELLFYQLIQLLLIMIFHRIITNHYQPSKLCCT
mgnify:CR=1 FL=1